MLPVSDLMSTGAEGTLGAGVDLLEWGTTAFSEMACMRPLYLQVTCASASFLCAISSGDQCSASCMPQVALATHKSA